MPSSTQIVQSARNVYCSASDRTAQLRQRVKPNCAAKQQILMDKEICFDCEAPVEMGTKLSEAKQNG